ncbi:nucleoside triphosphate pyrophosphohydrolase [Salirhabdus salicampi]|uniref:nucleoside triphosphate pyrophosphohydrolase n=1 Tax=Salirhabdus salicampi TaxID=476102 RepID=UPI0020C54CDD|nr:nucleoside triphosphate pyrophosphohydrolase [Salirhabdus salicampi]MCP8615236.1 nucleoside triphosphate pyrophosphohydrolase [Salirhabdus salicampi]
MPVYHKLVRDLIPQLIEKNGKKFSTRILDDNEYITALKAKLEEEIEEYLNAENNQDSLEELADVLELIYALAKTHGESFEKIEEIRRQKAEKRGGFNEKVYLIEVEDNQ